MQRTCAFLCCLVLLLPVVSTAQSKQTPAPEDVPQPVAGDLGMAGAICPDIARYLNVRSATAPSISPDGARLAYRTSVTGQPQVWVSPVGGASGGGSAHPQQITFGESVTFHDWSPTGEWIAYGTDRGGNEREGFYLISPDGTRETELLEPSESFRVWGGWSRDGSLIAYAATEAGGADFNIYTLNLTATPLHPFRVYAGKGGVYVASWQPDNRGLLLTRARGEDANDVLYLDLRSGNNMTLFEPTEAASYDSFAWTPDGRGFYMATNEGREFAGLAHFDMQTRKLRWVETPSRDVEFVRLSADGRYLAWTENADGFSELHIRDLVTNHTEVVTPTLQHQVRQPVVMREEEERERERSRERGATTRGGRARERAEREEEREARRTPPATVTSTPLRGVINSLEWAADAPRLAVQYSSPQVPGDIWVFDLSVWRGRRSGSLRAMAPPPPRRGTPREDWIRVTQSSVAGLDTGKFVAPEAVSFPSHDGLTIYGLLYVPPAASTAKRAPVILNVHGGPTSQARPGFNSVHQYLLARGYAILDLNFRGSTGFGKRFTRLDNGRLRPNAVKDMSAAIDWLKRSAYPVDASKAAVMGGSYGGYMTFAALAQLPGTFAAGVSSVGVSNWVTALEGASPQLKASDRIEYGNIDDPAEREFFRELSPLTHIHNIRAPLMVLHGANDPRDPVTEADQMVRAVRERGGDVEYLRFPDEGHGIRKLSNRITAYRRVARFLERTLGPGAVQCRQQQP